MVPYTINTIADSYAFQRAAILKGVTSNPHNAIADSNAF